MAIEKTKPERVQAIAHVAIAVSDLEGAIGFWQGVLGFTLDGTAEVSGSLPEDETGVVGIRSKVAQVTKNGLSIELYQPLAPEGRKTYRPTPADIGSWHLALRVTDLDEIVHASREWGWQVRGKVVTVEEGPGPIGARLVYMHNADGTILEFVQLPES